MNKKSFVAAAVCLIASTSSFAGGLLTNTNHSASFLRNPSRDAVIDIDAVYMNPAGVAFLNNGFHFGLSLQNAKQTRQITTTFPTLALNANYPGETSRKYVGNAYAPVIPSFQAAYVWDKWTVGADFSICGGGGKCKFDDGLGSFEAPYSALLASSLLPQVNGMMALQKMPYQATGYTMDMYLHGRQYYFGLSVGGTYKVNDHLAFGAGVRAVIANCNYSGALNNIGVQTNAPEAVNAAVNQQIAPLTAANDISLDTDQKGLGFTPFLSVDYKVNEHWNFAAKYEFKTRMRLQNHTNQASYPEAAKANIAQFDEKITKEVAEDIPGIFTIGAQYSPIECVRINAGFHYYDDTHATRYANKHKQIDKGTIEYSAGAEWDINKWVTISFGAQRTNYSLSDEFMNDMSFNTSSTTLGGGVRVHITKNINVDLGYMHNLYDTKDVVTKNFAGSNFDKTDSYTRTNRAFALGVNLEF